MSSCAQRKPAERHARETGRLVKTVTLAAVLVFVAALDMRAQGAEPRAARGRTVCRASEWVQRRQAFRQEGSSQDGLADQAARNAGTG
eukprot:490980-Pyramimonas_sp.AAC.1